MAALASAALLWVLLLVLFSEAPAANTTAAFQAAAPAALTQKLGPPKQRLRVVCAASASSKQSCLFSNVCLKEDANMQLTVVLPGPSKHEDRDLLQAHLNTSLAGVYAKVVLVNDTDLTNYSIAWDPHAVTVLWKAHHSNHGSFGHAMVNFAYPIFQVLQNHFDNEIPPKLQLLVHYWRHPVLKEVLQGTISSNTMLVQERFAQLKGSSKDTLCFQGLLLGDGGYVAASRASLSNSGQLESKLYSTGPSFYASNGWWNFRRYVLQVAGLAEGRLPTRRIILLNDKRYGPLASGDRRMISNADDLAVSIQAAYPQFQVVVARFRDLPWVEQLQLLVRAQIFITTQGSSAFRTVFQPRGSTCIMVGSPEAPGSKTDWQNFHELDKWFPLTYVQFQRYHVVYENTMEYQVHVDPGHWQPADPIAARDWWLYNADVTVRFDRLQPLIEQALSALE